MLLEECLKWCLNIVLKINFKKYFVLHVGIYFLSMFTIQSSLKNNENGILIHTR